MKHGALLTLLAAAIVAACGYGIRAWQDAPKFQELENSLIGASYRSYEYLGGDQSGAPPQWWTNNTGWKGQIDSDLARPVKDDVAGRADTDNEDHWGTAYLIAQYKDRSFAYDPSMSDAEQDTRIRFLCFVVRKRHPFQCNEIGRAFGDLDTYPFTALERNVRLIKSAFAALLPYWESNSPQPDIFLLSNISQPWAQDLYFEAFGREAFNGHLGTCMLLLDILWDASRGRGLTVKPKASPKAGAQAVLDRIRSRSWGEISDSPMQMDMGIKARLKLIDKASSAPAQ